MAVAEISPEGAQRRLGELQAIDVRAEHEFRGPPGYVRGAIPVPLSELEARAPVGRARGPRRGIRPVLNLAGGMIAWNPAQLPVERAKPGSLATLVASVSAWLALVGGLAPDTAGLPLAQPTRKSVEAALARIEDSFSRAGAPADLDLSLAFRRALARL